ncbi:MAG: hypothetical protein NC399_08365 [Muribaculum sp.]|nr:hypothetical protein [Muribaculum sp.]
MAITDLDRKEIEETAEFLERRGYIKAGDSYSVYYTWDNICISVVYPPNSEECDVNIKFMDVNQVFSVGWIAFVRKNIKEANEKIKYIKALLKYIEEDFNQITSYQFCVDTNCLIDAYVEKHRSKFEDSVKEFMQKVCHD